MVSPPAILFSTFEPSGDALAAGTIARLLGLWPGLRVYGLGGPKMAAAGAEVIEHTTHRGSMVLETLAQVRAHGARLARLRRWLAANPVGALVPVDSPAGNWSICRLVRQHRPEARIVHLVAPQLWAWAPWRIRKLRRLTDRVLCLLPFEPAWFERRGVPAAFVGHPVFDPFCYPSAPGVSDLPGGHPRLALLPGSRRGEILRNWPTMLGTFVRLRRDSRDLLGVVAALDEPVGRTIRDITLRRRGVEGWPEGLSVSSGRAPEILDWCDLALVASGTVTLELARRRRPMVAMYNVSPVSLVAMGWMVTASTYTLPNLVSEWAGLGRIVPELIPHFGGVGPVVRQVRRLLEDPEAGERQRAGLARVAALFDGRPFSEESARELVAVLESRGGRGGGAGD
jgi:lipid-A-disaccharide synthase